MAQLIENLRGQASNPLLLKGSHFDETILVAEFQASDTVDAATRQAVLHTHFARTVLFYLHRQHSSADDDIRSYSKIPQESSTFFLVSSNFSSLRFLSLHFPRHFFNVR